MLKAQSRKLKGALRHIRIDIVDTCNTLPHPADSNYSVMVKPKRKLQYRGHVYFESVSPNIILRLLQYLKLNNLLYLGIKINLYNISIFLINEKSLDSALINS